VKNEREDRRKMKTWQGVIKAALWKGIDIRQWNEKAVEDSAGKSVKRNQHEQSKSWSE